jgi:hypothetical protein
MEQASKYLVRIVGLGLLGAISLGEGCSLQQQPPSRYATALASFFILTGLLLAVGAVVIMVVWAVKSVRS